MAELSAMRSTSSEVLRLPEQRMHSASAMRDAGDSLSVRGCGAERLAYLLRRAIELMGSDTQAASRCLQDASILLGVESRRTTGETPEVPRFQSGGLARWQARLTVEYIEEHLGSKIKARELADMLSFSKSHFSRAFKRTFDVPLMSYVFRRRVERAKLMLTGTREQLIEIALSCGFADQSHLNRVFRRAVGMSPGLWRRTSTDTARAKAAASG